MKQRVERALEVDKLSWRSVTQGSQIILPAYPLTFFIVGIIFLTQSPNRTINDAYSVAKAVMAIPTWGVFFLVVAGVQIGAMATGSRPLFRGTLVVGAGISGFWAACITCSAFGHSTVSFTAGVWIFFVMLAHIASARSVARDKVGHTLPSLAALEQVLDEEAHHGGSS